MNILCIFYTQNRQTFQTKNHQECKSSVNFTLLISIRFSFPHKFSLCIFIKFLSSDLLKIIFYFFVSTSTFVPAIVRYQIFSFPVLSTFRKRKWTSYSSPARCSSVSMMPVYSVFNCVALRLYIQELNIPILCRFIQESILKGNLQSYLERIKNQTPNPEI